MYLKNALDKNIKYNIQSHLHIGGFFGKKATDTGSVIACVSAWEHLLRPND